MTMNGGAATPTANPLAVTDTGVLAVPLVGSIAISVSVRVADVTVNALACVIVSNPLTTTVRAPIAAPGLIRRVAMAVPFGCTAINP